MSVESFTFAPIYIESISLAMDSIFSVEGIVFLLLGTLLGLLFGVLPGLGGAVAIALLIPLTFGLDSHLAFIMMTAALGGSAFGGSISAILLNIPGTAPNAATLLDGYPLAKKGEANFALGASATASALGALVGIAFLLLALPVIRSLLRLFGPPEFFALALFGLMIIAVATRGSLINGLIGGCLGFMLAFVGWNPVTGGERFTFGILFVRDGIGLIPVIVGVFAISEMILLFSKRTSVTQSAISSGGSVLDGVRSVFEHRWLFLRSAATGVVIGLVPAAGGTVANFVAYVQAKQLATNSETFGTGDIRGVIASEAANDAKDGGAIIPTIGFGIPGSAGWAVMLGAFVLHGIIPGPQLMEDHLDIVFIIIFTLVLSNITTSLIGLALADHLAKITLTPIEVLAPLIFLLSMIGAYTVNFEILDVVLTGVIGIFGFVMIKYDISRIALIIGIVLGPIAEQSFHQSLQLSRGSYLIFVTRPVALLIFFFLVLAATYPLFKDAIPGRSG